MKIDVYMKNLFSMSKIKHSFYYFKILNAVFLLVFLLNCSIILIFYGLFILFFLVGDRNRLINIRVGIENCIFWILLKFFRLHFLFYIFKNLLYIININFTEFQIYLRKLIYSIKILFCFIKILVRKKKYLLSE